jgi:GH24 family phage-related lysozyme (muramidase)
MKKSQEKLKKSKKYESFYEKLKAKKYRNCGCQIDMNMVEKKSTYRDVLTTKRESEKNNYLSSAALQS